VIPAPEEREEMVAGPAADEATDDACRRPSRGAEEDKAFSDLAAEVEERNEREVRRLRETSR
jgi:hypothetical protein